MIAKENYTFTSKDDAGTTIHAVKWQPGEGEPVAVLIIAHGMQEYIERYEPFAEYMANKGFVVMGHDHIGHGDSVSGPSDWGIMHTKYAADTMVDDMFTNYELAVEQYPDIPHFILGHSMGSYLLRRFLIQKADRLDALSGAIIMGTGQENPKTVAMGKRIVALIAKFKGWDYRSKMVEGIMLNGGAYKQFDTTGKNPANSWLSKNRANVERYYKDPKCTYRFSLNGYQILLDCTDFDAVPENVKKMDRNIPIFFVSGSMDPVGNMGEGVKAAYESFKTAGIKDVRMKLYDNDRHEILNETDRENVFEDLYKWMTNHIDKISDPLA